jgi:hypothetical protein
MSRATELADRSDVLGSYRPEWEKEAAAELRRLDRVNAGLVEALQHLYAVAVVPDDKDYAAATRAAAALTSATKETK